MGLVLPAIGRRYATHADLWSGIRGLKPTATFSGIATRWKCRKVRQGILCCPYRAKGFLVRQPRALPSATMCQPFRLKGSSNQSEVLLMFDDLSDLYQQVILDHCKRPRNFHELASPTCS